MQFFLARLQKSGQSIYCTVRRSENCYYDLDFLFYQIQFPYQNVRQWVNGFLLPSKWLINTGKRLSTNSNNQ